MVTTRELPRDLRRARLLAARRYGVRSIPRRAVLRGEYDGGEVVSRHSSLPSCAASGAV